MVEQRIGVVDHQRAGLPHLEAQVDVVERHGELLREAADTVEQFRADHHAGRSHGGIILGSDRPVEVAVLDLVEADKGVAGNAAEPDHNTRVLDRVILVEEPASDNSHVRSLGISHHLPHCVGVDELHIVVHQEVVLT